MWRKVREIEKERKNCHRKERANGRKRKEMLKNERKKRKLIGYWNKKVGKNYKKKGNQTKMI
jgi:hypothetical protein